MCNENYNIKDIYKNMACDGDNSIANRMKYMGVQPQISKNIRALYNKYTLKPYIEEELREQSNREWWNSDHLE